MKALFIKDLRYLLQQKSFILLVFVIAILLTVTQNDNYIFIISYLTFMGVISAIGSISLDDQNRNLAFLFTLPIDRKTYVREKYLFSIVLGIVFCVLATGLCLLFRVFSDYKAPIDEIVFTGVATLGAMVIFLALMTPLNLKFGAKRARLASIISIGIFFLFVALAAIIVEFADALPLITAFLALPHAVLAAIACIVLLGCLVLSYSTSQRIIHKREF